MDRIFMTGAGKLSWTLAAIVGYVGGTVSLVALTGVNLATVIPPLAMVVSAMAIVAVLLLAYVKFLK